MKEWLSLHIYYHDSKNIDKVLVEGIEPIVRSVQKKFFFIRYWEGSPHIRLRFYANKNDIPAIQQLVADKLRKYFSTHPSKVVLTPENYYKNIGQAPAPMSEWYENHTIIEQPYEMELTRYGGKDGMIVAQELFWISSEIVFSILKRSFDRSEILSIGKNLMLVSLLATELNMEEVRLFFKRYSNYFKTYDSRSETESNFLKSCRTLFNQQQKEICKEIYDLCFQVFSGAERLMPLYRTWWFANRNALKKILVLHAKGSLVHPRSGLVIPENDVASAREATLWIFQSYIHMHNNRLGINPFEESYLAYLLSEGISKLKGVV